MGSGMICQTAGPPGGVRHTLTWCETGKMIWRLLGWRVAAISAGSRWAAFSRPHSPLQSSDWCTVSPLRNPALPWSEFWEQVGGGERGEGGGR